MLRALSPQSSAKVTPDGAPVPHENADTQPPVTVVKVMFAEKKGADDELDKPVAKQRRRSTIGEHLSAMDCSIQLSVLFLYNLTYLLVSLKPFFSISPVIWLLTLDE